MEFKTELYGLNKKIKNARPYGCVFNQIINLTKKIYSILSHIDIQYYLKLRIPIIHRQFFQNNFTKSLKRSNIV